MLPLPLALHLADKADDGCHIVLEGALVELVAQCMGLECAVTMIQMEMSDKLHHIDRATYREACITQKPLE
jgi:hypothetical protein